MLTLEKLPVDWDIIHPNNLYPYWVCVIDFPTVYGIVSIEKTFFGAIAKALKEYQEQK